MSHYAYYNDNDPFVCRWLENLIEAGHIASGDVDCRPIEKVKPTDLEGYTQCHFFAGIGGWSYALRLAGWKDEWPVWTFSCPCQPFSHAGRRKGEKDKRHLWPHIRHLIPQHNPPTCFGEQVASADGCKWLQRVRYDMEVLGYAFAAADLCAAGAGSPQTRQRLFFVADSARKGLSGSVARGSDLREFQSAPSAVNRDEGVPPGVFNIPTPKPDRGSDGLPRPVGIIRALGNSIVPQVAAEFISAYLEARTMAPRD